MNLKSLSQIILLFLILLLSYCSSINHSVVNVENKYLEIEFDDSLYSKIISKVGNNEVELTDFSVTEYLIADGKKITKYYYTGSKSQEIN